MLREALSRLGKLFLLAAVGSGVVALPIGLALGASVSRSLSLGWYATGSFLILGGFLVGNRGPARPADQSGWMPFSLRSRMLRWASRQEQEESINLSAVLIGLGFAIIALGIVADTRYRLI
ncbi:MAG TPA: hypothetical protein VFL66_03590 [Gaiellaceae bacterium]|nr:hypothetical protein [Gaiellaceae bacterium]